MSELKPWQKNGPLCIACDQCRRFLGTDGKLHDNADPKECEMIANFRNDGAVAAVDVATSAAQQAGWKVTTACPEEGDYTDIATCPDCQRKPPACEPEWMKQERLKSYSASSPLQDPSSTPQR